MGTENDEFEQFAAAGDVQVGDADTSGAADDKGEKTAKRGPPKLKEGIETNTPADDDDQGGDEGDDEGGDEGDDEGGDEGGDDNADDKSKKSAKDHQIERLKREKADLRRQLREGANAGVSARLEAIEKSLSGGKTDDTKTAGTKSAPDPTDLTKYPLGHLDDRYIEDKLEWLAEDKATKLADSALQREQENERNRAATDAQKALLVTVDEITAKGSDLYPDFQEEVVETAIKGEWKLSQTTFEAAAEADHGAQILYELSQDKKEAARVAGLSPLQQLRFVSDRDAEISKTKKPRTKPKAGEPPENGSKGASSKARISPATDNLDDFEKAWDADAKGKR